MIKRDWRLETGDWRPEIGPTGMLRNDFMRHMREHEALGAYSGNNLFCSGLGFTKQILEGVFGVFCLILPHMPHVFSDVRQLKVKNMRHMREHEDRVFKGFHLFRIGMGVSGGIQDGKYEDAFGTSSCFASCFARRTG